MTDREYWIMTEIFVYLHGSDECKKTVDECPHCKFISKTFDVVWDTTKGVTREHKQPNP